MAYSKVAYDRQTRIMKKYKASGYDYNSLSEADKKFLSQFNRYMTQTNRNLKKEFRTRNKKEITGANMTLNEIYSKFVEYRDKFRDTNTVNHYEKANHYYRLYKRKGGKRRSWITKQDKYNKKYNPRKKKPKY